MKNLLPALLVFGAFTAQAAEPAGVTVVDLHRPEITAGPYTISLGDPDNPAAPHAWEGPIDIATRKATHCTVSDDVSLIEAPLLLVHDHLLYVPAYAGSIGRLFVVDADSCAVKWTSPNYAGHVMLSAQGITLPGHALLTIGTDGMPVTSP